MVKQQRKGEERDKCDSGSNGMDVSRFRDDFTLKECVLYIYKYVSSDSNRDFTIR